MSILSPQAYPTLSSRSAYTYAKVKRADEARLREAGGQGIKVRVKHKTGASGEREDVSSWETLGSADDEAKHRFKQQDSWWCVHRGTYHH